MAKKLIIRGGQKGVAPILGPCKKKLIGNKKGVAPAGGGGVQPPGGGGN